LSDKIDIITYSKAELRKLLEEPLWWDHTNLPFTKSRLSCYLDNPHSRDDDILWLIAWQEERIVAYLGLVPDTLSPAAGASRLAWFSSWWADPRVRKTGLAGKLTSMGLNLYTAIGIDSGTPWSMRKMRESGDFFVYTQRPRSFWFLNLNQRSLKDFGKDKAIPRPLVKMGHFALGHLISLRLRLWLKRMGKSNISIEYVSAPDLEAMDLIASLSANELCIKDAGTLNWRTDLPSRMAQLAGLPSKAKSYFGNSGFSVRSYSIKLWRGSELIGFVNICLSDGYLKIPYLFLKTGCERELAVIIGSLCLNENIDVIYSQNRLVKDTLARYRVPHWASKSYPMDLLLSTRLKDLPGGLHLQDGDGAF